MCKIVFVNLNYKSQNELTKFFLGRISDDEFGRNENPAVPFCFFMAIHLR